jgi:predicted transcriptional regulator
MSDLNMRLEIAEIILREVSRGPIRRIELEKRVFKSRDVTYSCFSNMFAFLVVDGDIVKVSGERTAPFKLTEKGKAFLAWRAKT